MRFLSVIIFEKVSFTFYKQNLKTKSIHIIFAKFLPVLTNENLLTVNNLCWNL